MNTVYLNDITGGTPLPVAGISTLGVVKGGGNVKISASGVMNVDLRYMRLVKCDAVDSVNGTWTAKIAEYNATEELYVFPDEATAMGEYTAPVPVAGAPYMADNSGRIVALVNNLYNTFADLPDDYVFYAPLTEEKSAAETGQTWTKTGSVQYTTFGGIACAYFPNTANQGGNYLRGNTTEAFPAGNQAFTMSCWGAQSRIPSNYDNTLMYFGSGSASPAAGTAALLACYRGTQPALYNADTFVKATPAAAVGTMKWHHYLAVFDGATGKIYYDGTELAAAAMSCALIGGYFYIGARNNNAQTMGGYLASARIYDRVLTPAEIAALATEFTPVYAE